MKFYKRHIAKTLSDCANEYSAIVVYGPRQIGKSTLLEDVFVKTGYAKSITFDDKNIKNLALHDPKTLLNIYNPPLFIDEFQKAPEILETIKLCIDKNKQPKMFFLSGSDILPILNSVETLSTRMCLIPMLPLSQSEIDERENWPFKPDFDAMLNRKKECDQIAIFNRIIKGSMPDINNGTKTNISAFYFTYITSTVLKDIREDITNVSNITSFWNFLKCLTSYVGQKINIQNISSKINVSDKTIKKWIDALEASGIIFLLRPYSQNILKKAIKSPKLYFYDTGLICSILNYIDPIDLLKSEQAGHIFECYAISEIYKSYTNAGLKYKIYYIEDAYSNKEIDFIIEADNNEIYPIEIKKSATYHDKFFSNFNIVNSIKNKKILPMTVICCVENIMKIKDNMYVLPISYL